MEETQIHDWKEVYERAVLELDPAKFPARILEAKSCILSRLSEVIEPKEKVCLLYSLKMCQRLLQHEKELLAA